MPVRELTCSSWTIAHAATLPDGVARQPVVLSTSVRVWSCCLCYGQYSSPQQVQVGPPVHRTLHQLQTVHLTFRLPIAPRLAQRRKHGRFVSCESAGETLQLG